MKIFLLLSAIIPFVGLAQQNSTPFKEVVDTLQNLKLNIPANWTMEYGIFLNRKHKKVGEVLGFIDDCSFKTHRDYIKQVRKGYIDDPTTTKFISSDTITLNKRLWTRALRTVEMWNGKGGGEKAFSYEYFTFLERKCFQVTFYSKQKKPVEKTLYEQVLSSIQPL